MKVKSDRRSGRFLPARINDSEARFSEREITFAGAAESLSI